MPLENRSLVKYKLVIDEFGGWTAFQQLLRTMRGIAISIAFASIIGLCLMESGAADKVVRRFLALFGEKHATPIRRFD